MMTRIHPTIFLGDLIRAFVHLQPIDDDTRQLIAALLGLQHQKVEPEPLRLARSSEEGNSEERPVNPELPLSVTASTEIPLPLALPSYTSNLVLSTLEYTPVKAEEWRIDVEALAPQKEEDFYDPPPLEPLFKPIWTRSILNNALSTTSGDGPLDTPNIVEMLARGEYLQRLPRLPWPTLRRGIQLLIDKSDSMVPFTRDQAWLKDKIEEVVGIDKVQVLHFVGCPLQVAEKRHKKAWTLYCPPPPGTVVLLLTDLGIGRPMFSTHGAGVEEWLDFASRVHRGCCPLVAFVPYGPARWPRQLVDAMILMQWDRGTTVSTIRKLVGYAHEVAE